MYQQYDTPTQRLVKLGEIIRATAIVSIIITFFASITLISILSVIFGSSSLNISDLLFFAILILIAGIIAFIIEIIFLVRLHKAAEGTRSNLLKTAFQWYITAIIISFVLGLIIDESTINYSTELEFSFSFAGLIKDLVSTGLNFMAVLNLYKWSVETYQYEKDPLLNEVSRGFQLQYIGIIVSIIPLIGIFGSIVVLVGQFKSAKNLIRAYQSHPYYKDIPPQPTQQSYTQQPYSQSNTYNATYSNPTQNTSSPNNPTIFPSPQTNSPPADTFMMKNCALCGASVPKDAKFCNQCGHNFDL